MVTIKGRKTDCRLCGQPLYQELSWGWVCCYTCGLAIDNTESVPSYPYNLAQYQEARQEGYCTMCDNIADDLIEKGGEALLESVEIPMGRLKRLDEELTRWEKYHLHELLYLIEVLEGKVKHEEKPQAYVEASMTAIPRWMRQGVLYKTKGLVKRTKGYQKVLIDRFEGIYPMRERLAFKGMLKEPDLIEG